MNISKHEQRVLHVLALGGRINQIRNDVGKVENIICYSREGYVLSNCTLEIFKQLKSKRLVGSKQGKPYRITHLGARLVGSQMNQR